MTPVDPAPRCRYCGEQAPYGEARLSWLDWHYGLLHRSWWALKRLLRGDFR